MSRPGGTDADVVGTKGTGDALPVVVEDVSPGPVTSSGQPADRGEQLVQRSQTTLPSEASVTGRGEPEPVSPLVALKRHWKIGVALTLAGAFAGAAVGLVLPASYTAESRIAVGSNDLTALAIPGYAFAAGELAASTARYVDNSQALGALEPVLGEDAGEVSVVTASPIPQSNIIRVEVTASSTPVAVRATEVLTDYLIEQASRVNSSSDADELLQQLTELSLEVAETSVALDRASTEAGSTTSVLPPSEAAVAQVVDLTAQLTVLQARQAALQAQYEDAVTADGLEYQLVTVAEAAPSMDSASSQVQRYGLLGLVAGLLAGGLASVLLERRRTTDAEVGPAESPGEADVRHDDGRG